LIIIPNCIQRIRCTQEEAPQEYRSRAISCNLEWLTDNHAIHRGNRQRYQQSHAASV